MLAAARLAWWDSAVIVTTRRRLSGSRAPCASRAPPISSGEAAECLGRIIGSDRLAGKPDLHFTLTEAVRALQAGED